MDAWGRHLCWFCSASSRRIALKKFAVASLVLVLVLGVTAVSYNAFMVHRLQQLHPVPTEFQQGLARISNLANQTLLCVHRLARYPFLGF
jgi:hypothetical protein